MSFQVFGAAVSRGIAIGRAVLVSSSRVDVAHYFVPDADLVAEIARLRSARDRVAQSLEALQRDLPADAPNELSALLDVHLMLLRDETLAEATKVWILERKYNAEWALSAQYEVLARQFDGMEDEYLRERKADLEQVVERLLKALAEGGTGAAVDPRLIARATGEDRLVLVAGDISPADMLQLRSSVFEGLITDVGGRTSLANKAAQNGAGHVAAAHKNQRWSAVCHVDVPVNLQEKGVKGGSIFAETFLCWPVC